MRCWVIVRAQSARFGCKQQRGFMRMRDDVVDNGVATQTFGPWLLDQFKGLLVGIVLGAIASEPGIARLKARDPSIKILAAAVDPHLNEKGYIIPGLGDAGDRCYGLKAPQSSAISE